MKSVDVYETALSMALPDRAIDADKIPWVPQGDSGRVWFKPLRFDLTPHPLFHGLRVRDRSHQHQQSKATHAVVNVARKLDFSSEESVLRFRRVQDERSEPRVLVLGKRFGQANIDKFRNYK